MKTIMYKGLRPRSTYEEKINYLQNSQDIIKYPNRLAKQIRTSPYLTQLDGVGQSVLEEQQLSRIIEEEKQLEIKKLATKSNQTVKEIRSPPRMTRTMRLQTGDDTISGKYNYIGTPIPSDDEGFLSPLDRDLGNIQKQEQDAANKKKEHIGSIKDLIKENLQRPFDDAIQTVIGGASSSSGPNPNAASSSSTDPKAAPKKSGVELLKDLNKLILESTTKTDYLNTGVKLFTIKDLADMIEANKMEVKDLADYTNTIQNKKILLRLLLEEAKRKRNVIKKELQKIESEKQIPEMNTPTRKKIEKELQQAVSEPKTNTPTKKTKKAKSK